MVTITIHVKPYLAAYMYASHTENAMQGIHAIRLKPIETTYHHLKNRTVKRPANISGRETGNLTIILPDPRDGKDPQTYNYLGEESVKFIEEDIEATMKAELYTYMLKGKFKEGSTYKQALINFMKEYRIEDRYEDGLMKAFQRWRKKRFQTPMPV